MAFTPPVQFPGKPKLDVDSSKNVDPNNRHIKKYTEKYDPKSPKNIKALKENAAKKRRQWWATNWIGFWGLVVAVIALAVSIIALLK